MAKGWFKNNPNNPHVSKSGTKPSGGGLPKRTSYATKADMVMYHLKHYGSKMTPLTIAKVKEHFKNKPSLKMKEVNSLMSRGKKKRDFEKPLTQIKTKRGKKGFKVITYK